MKNIPTYEEAVALVNLPNSPFYESKSEINGFRVSVFNYRLAQWSDFNAPGALEMRGITYVFNADGTVYKVFPLLEKFFNLNQVPTTEYSAVKNFKIKSIYNKEDGSVASFIRLPDGTVFGKSKMSVITEQAEGIMRVYRANAAVRTFVDWTLDNDLTAVFEYVAPHNKIVLNYAKEDLILLRLRDNLTGELLDLNDYASMIGDLNVAKAENEFTLDQLIELAQFTEDKEGWIVEFENGLLMKVKTDWYFKLHGLLTEDLYKENVVIGYILNDEIDDIIAQIPVGDVAAHERVNKLIDLVKREIEYKIADIKDSYERNYVTVGSRKEYALKFRKVDRNFAYVMKVVDGIELAKMTIDEAIEAFETVEAYESAVKRCDVYELAKNYISDRTKRLLIARDWLKSIDPTFFFIDVDEVEA